MAIGRQRALNRLESLRARVEEHLAKIAAEPESQAVGHWRKEVTEWLNEMERLVPHLGKKTGAEWSALVARRRAQLGGP